MAVIKLKVAEAIQDDVNKGIVRIDNSFMLQIGVRPGDIVEIEGDRKTVAVADRAYPGDIQMNIIRMDGIIRRNAKTGIGETVNVRKADVREAKKVVIAPAQKGIVVRASPELFKRGLLGRAVVKGDIVSLGGSSRRRSTMERSPFFDDIFSMMENEISQFGFSDLKFIVADAKPAQAVIISESTEVDFNPEAVEVTEDKVLEVTYEDIGGLSEEIKKIREMVELPLKHPEIFERLGIEPPKGVLLQGPPGTGKTLLAKAVANETNSNFFLINGPEIMSKFYGQSEANVRKKFEEAEKSAPAIIFIDEIDAIAPKREESYGEVERRVVAQLLALMDGLKSRGKVVVIAATNIPDSLDPALRRPGRFDRELEIGVPNKEGRLAILKIHTRWMPLETDPKSIDRSLSLSGVREALQQAIGKADRTAIIEAAKKELKDIDATNRKKKYNRLFDAISAVLRRHNTNQGSSLKNFVNDCLDNVAGKLRDSLTRGNSTENVLGEVLDQFGRETDPVIHATAKERMLSELAEVTYGFVGADLASLTREAAMEVLRRILPDLKLEEDEPLPKEILEKLQIKMSDFREALKVVRPSAMREVLVEIPSVKWDDVGGMKEVKQELVEAVEWPLKHPQSFRRMGVKPPKGVLIYGAPGTGKTLLARAIATESKANFIPVKGPELLSKWVGESEKAVRKIFKKARQTAPSIIFFDEIDSLTPSRSASSESHVTESVVNQFLTELDGLEDLNEVVIVAATNRPDMIDTALLRPGRFDRIVMAPVPDRQSREAIFAIHTRQMPLNGVDIKKLADKSEGYVGADIEAVCREAAIFALREDMAAKSVLMRHFESAFEKVRPSASPEIAKMYENIKKFFSQARAKEMKEEKPSYMG